MTAQEEKERLKAELQEFQLNSNLLAMEFLRVIQGRHLKTGLVLRAMLVLVEGLIQVQPPAERARSLLSLQAFIQMLQLKFPDLPTNSQPVPQPTQLH